MVGSHDEHTPAVHRSDAHSAAPLQRSPSCFDPATMQPCDASNTGEVASWRPHTSPLPQPWVSSQPAHAAVTPNHVPGSLTTSQIPLAQPCGCDVSQYAPTDAGAGTIGVRPLQPPWIVCAPMFASCALPAPVFAI